MPKGVFASRISEGFGGSGFRVLSLYFNIYLIFLKTLKEQYDT